MKAVARSGGKQFEVEFEGDQLKIDTGNSGLVGIVHLDLLEPSALEGVNRIAVSPWPSSSLEGLVFDGSVDLKPFVGYEFDNNNNNRASLVVTLRDKTFFEQHKTGTMSFIDYYR